MSSIYPDTKNLFKYVFGRPPKYTPQDIAEQFEAYVKDCEENPITVETIYRKQVNENLNEKRREGQKREQKFARPLTVGDFVVRWLGMSMTWWQNFDQRKTHRDHFVGVKKSIEQYCYDVKFNGAAVGLYNANIIARDLGLKDKVEVDRKGAGQGSEEMTIEQMKEEIDRLMK